MLSPNIRIAALAVLGALTPAPAALARWYGSTMHGTPNATYGCEAAVVYGPVSGVELQPTNQTSCTYRHGGYIGSNRFGSIVPSTGRIVRIRVRSGAHPAKLRVTILTGSSRVDTRTGEDLPGTYTCCTARSVGRAFRPRANALTVKKVDIPVSVTRSTQLHNRIHASDVVALSAFGAGSLPLRVDPDVGANDQGSPIAIGYWPATARGEPRDDGYAMSGIDLLFGWDFRAKR